MDTLYRFKPSTVIEPLVNGWVAYTHNVAPLAAGLTARHYQLGNLRQYLASPAANVEACRNPTLRAGRFVNVPVERVADVQALLERTEAELGESVRLGDALMQFQQQLPARASEGLPMAPLYPRLPEPLRGMVELFYDYATRPGVRVIEPLVYASSHYKPHLQSFRLHALALDRDRDFIFSTPRLAGGGELHWHVPFDDPRVDRLFRLDVEPLALPEIRALLGLDVSSDAMLLGVLEVAPPKPAPRPSWDGDTPRITHFGHACVLVEWKGTNILVDPCIGVRPSAEPDERPSYDDLPAHIDYVLVTHSHHDHFTLETLLRLRNRIGCLVVPRAIGLHYGDVSLKLLARRIGFREVVEMDTLERLPLPDGEIIAVPFLGEHADLPHAKTGYVVRAGDQQMLFAADSDCLDVRQYERLLEVLGPVQHVFLGLECVGAPMSWSCGAFFPVPPTVEQDQSRRQHGCDATRGMKLLRALRATHLYVYAMGLEPWYEWLLGLAYTAEAEQIRQMKKILAAATADGLDARLLRAPAQLVLEAATSRHALAKRTDPVDGDGVEEILL
ncbi:MAG: MBL fold metallo-hydrolase [Rhizobacter sp.]